MHIWVLKLKDAIKQSILLEAGCQPCQFSSLFLNILLPCLNRRFDLLRQALGQQRCFFWKGQCSTCVLMDIFHVDEKSHGS